MKLQTYNQPTKGYNVALRMGSVNLIFIDLIWFWQT